MKRGIVIPTYNECNNIEPLITEIFQGDPDLHILVMDDNSPDGTAKVVRRLCRAYPDKVKLIVNEEKQGLGAAYTAGLSQALDDGWDLLCEMDADLFHWAKSHDLVMGSRYIKSNGYSFQIETAYRTHLMGFKIKETPIVFIERKQGKSKMSNGIVLEAILMVWRLRAHRKRLANMPRKPVRESTADETDEVPEGDTNPSGNPSLSSAPKA